MLWNISPGRYKAQTPQQGSKSVEICKSKNTLACESLREYTE